MIPACICKLPEVAIFKRMGLPVSYDQWLNIELFILGQPAFPLLTIVAERTAVKKHIPQSELVFLTPHCQKMLLSAAKAYLVPSRFL